MKQKPLSEGEGTEGQMLKGGGEGVLNLCCDGQQQTFGGIGQGVGTEGSLADRGRGNFLQGKESGIEKRRGMKLESGDSHKRGVGIRKSCA